MGNHRQFYMKVLILVNAYIKNKSQIAQAQRIKEEFVKRGIDAVIKKNVNITSVINDRVEGEKYDCCIFLDKDKCTARMLEKLGVKLFNNAKAIELCDNKALTHIALSNNNIHMPDTISAPLCYYENSEPITEFLENVKSTLGIPLIAKKCYGSLGQGVVLIKDEKQLYDYEKSNVLVEHLYQKYIDCGGSDVRVIVIGGKVLCAMKRTNYNDFRSNIELGGIGENYAVTDEIVVLCERVSKILNLDYCGIDVMIDSNGCHYVCEVNSNAFFAGVEKYCKVNVASAYVSHIIEKLDIDNA